VKQWKKWWKVIGVCNKLNRRVQMSLIQATKAHTQKKLTWTVNSAIVQSIPIPQMSNIFDQPPISKKRARDRFPKPHRYTSPALAVADRRRNGRKWCYLLGRQVGKGERYCIIVSPHDTRDTMLLCRLCCWSLGGHTTQNAIIPDDKRQSSVYTDLAYRGWPKKQALTESSIYQ